MTIRDRLFWSTTALLSVFTFQAKNCDYFLCPRELQAPLLEFRNSVHCGKTRMKPQQMVGKV